MRPQPEITVPSRPFRVRKVIIPVAVSGSLIASALTVALVPAQAAEAATLGTFVVGHNPIALNQASDPGLGVLTPAADAAQNGMFGPQAAWPVIPLHTAVSRTGHLVSYGTPLNDGTVQAGLLFDDWDPTKGYDATSHVDSDSMGYDSFCNSLVSLMDGRLLMVGGNSSMGTMTFDPTTDAVAGGPNLNLQRWYGTALRLSDGRILVLGGVNEYNSTAFNTPNDQTGVATTPEIGTGSSAWKLLTGARSDDVFGAANNRWWYPRAFNAPDGTVFGMSGSELWTLDPTEAGSVRLVGSLPFDPKVSGSQVMYAPGRILVAGGGQTIQDDDAGATAEAAIVDIRGATPVVSRTSPMADPRNWLNLTVLPSGEVLANGGTRAGTYGGDANSVKQAEIWNPTTQTWRSAATAQRTRTYHSVSVLMPSGAVFTAGGGGAGYSGSNNVYGPENNLNAEMYYPSYLFTQNADGTVAWASRPALTSVAGSATYGGELALTIGDGRAIASASLITLPSVTHSQNTDQRRIPLTLTQAGGTVNVTLPTSTGTMPEGDYELTVVDSKGVPSTAQIVTIRAGQPGLVTVAPTTVPDPTVAPTGNAGTTGNGTATGTAGNTNTTATATGTGTGTGTTTGSGTATTTGSATGTGSGTATGAGTATTGSATAGAPAGNAATTGTGTGTTGDPSDTSTTVPSDGTTAGAIALTVGDSVRLGALGRTTTLVGHRGSVVRLRGTATADATSSRRATTWKVRLGLASARGISLESVDAPGSFLAAPGKGAGALRLVRKDRSTSFASRATFVVKPGRAGTGVSLRTLRGPVRYVTVDGSNVIVERGGSSAAAKRHGTFAIVGVAAGTSKASVGPLTTGRSVSLRSVGYSGALVQAAGETGTLHTSSHSASVARRGATWVVHTGEGGVQLESVEHPGSYLAASTAGAGALELLRRSASNDFPARTVFATSVVGDAASRRMQFRLRADPDLLLQQSDGALVLHRLGASGANGTFMVLPGVALAHAG